MLRILFLFIGIIIFLEPRSWAIEIYVHGHKYDSFEAYQQSEKEASAATPVPATLNNQQQDYIRQQSRHLGIKVDLNKIKTVQVRSGNLSPQVVHQLYVMGIESGMSNALQNFYHPWSQSGSNLPENISSDQLEGVIQEKIRSTKDPKLVIAQPGKLRIMSLSAKNST